jgi:multidrug resistance efflux pump
MKWKVLLFILVCSVLTACSGFGQPTPQPLPTVVLDNKSNNRTPQAITSDAAGAVEASGIVVPAQQAQLASLAGGNVKAVNAAVGDTVKTGQVLVTLAGSEKLAAAIAAGNLELATAQQVINSLNDKADKARADAQQKLADADKALKDAQDGRYRKNLARVTQATIDRANADLIIAKDVLKTAQENYTKYENRGENDVQRANAFSQVAAAQQKVDQLQWNVDWLLSTPNTLEIQQADAAIAVALADQAAARKEVEKLKSGPDPDAMALAKARLANAQAQLAASQTALSDLEVKAPFNGTLTKVNIHMGEWVVPGQPLILLVDLDKLRIETTDLSERDIPAVKMGQKVSIDVKALNKNVPGHVVLIAPLADTLGGDVVYKTTIELDSKPDGLRAGMTVDVQFGQ